MPKKKKVTAVNSDSSTFSRVREKVRVAGNMGMNTTNIFTNKTDLTELEKRLNAYIKKGKKAGKSGMYGKYD